jgi:hypothetical protein
MNLRTNLLLIAGGLAVLLTVIWSAIGIVLYGADAMMPNLLAGLAGASLEVAVAALVVDRLTARHQRREWDFAYRELARRGSEAFVDVMRLTFISSSPEALAANIDLYGYFVQLAYRHLGDLRSDIESSASVLNVNTHEQYRRVERRISWCLDQLQDSPTEATISDDLLSILNETANFLFDLLSGDGDGHQIELADAKSSVTQARETSRKSIPEHRAIEYRLLAQSILLENQKYAPRLISSISEDIDGDFSIPYFMIDYLLLADTRAGSYR